MTPLRVSEATWRGTTQHVSLVWSDRQTDDMSCKLALLLISTMLALAPTALTGRQIDFVSRRLALTNGLILLEVATTALTDGQTDIMSQGLALTGGSILLVVASTALTDSRSQQTGDHEHLLAPSDDKSQHMKTAANFKCTYQSTRKSSKSPLALKCGNI